MVARSPAQLPELVSLLEMSNVSPAAVHVAAPSGSEPWFRSNLLMGRPVAAKTPSRWARGQVRGLAALLLGTCLLELPSQAGVKRPSHRAAGCMRPQEDAALVSQGQLMDLLARLRKSSFPGFGYPG